MILRGAMINSSHPRAAEEVTKRGIENIISPTAVVELTRNFVSDRNSEGLIILKANG